MITVAHSPDLQRHLETFEVDGTTVALSLFEGGRLFYPERRRLEYSLDDFIEPYRLEHEARVIVGMDRRAVESAYLLANELTRALDDGDGTLELLWESHSAWSSRDLSLDRFVAALAMIQLMIEEDAKVEIRQDLCAAAVYLIHEMHRHGFPPGSRSFEEIFDGAPPACVGLCLVDLDWKSRGEEP